MKNGATRVFSSSWFWAAIPTLVISFFIQDVAKHYSVEVQKKYDGNAQTVHTDLDGDGFTEIISASQGPPLNKFPVMDPNGKFVEQWNLPDDLTKNISEIITGDYDHDSLSEIYVFTTRDDSVFLNVNEIMDPRGVRMERLFITTLVLVQGHIDSDLKLIGFFDQNGDGFDECYFRIKSGYGLVPRLCYYYDLVNRKLKSSPFMGVSFNNPHFTDLDNDGRPEIVSNMTSPGNYHTPTPYTDYSAWLMVLNDQLEFKFPPIEYPGFGSMLDIYGMGRQGDKKLVVIYNYNGTNDTLPNKQAVHLYTSEGKFIRQKTFKELGLNIARIPQLIKRGKQELIVLLDHNILLMDENLSVVRSALVPDNEFHDTFLMDIDADGQDELILFSHNQKLLAAYSADLKLYDVVPLDIFSTADIQVSNIRPCNGENKIHIKSGDYAYTLQLIENRYYLLSYLIYPAIYFGFLLFIGFIKKVNTQQVEKREQQKRKLQTLQLQSIKGQFDPHFTFNALNSVASLLYLNDRNAAYDYLNQFTRLLRQLLSDAERNYRTLEEEIEFVSAYLNLEKLRFGDKFNYTIRLDETITRQEIVPVMSIQTFAENAIKHGLMPLTEGGELNITIEKEDGYLKLATQDNGVGRKKASENSKRQGKGLRMIHELFDILNQINKKPIQLAITDLYHDDGTPAGTRAEVLVPLELVENNHKPA
jgi:hypothetical protein